MIFTVQRKDDKSFWIEEDVGDDDIIYRIVYNSELETYTVLYFIGYDYKELPDYSKLDEDELFCQYCSYDFEYLKIETLMEIQIKLPYLIPYCTLLQPTILKVQE